MSHFAIDAGLWRLRDPSRREFLAARVPELVPAKNAAFPFGPNRSVADIR
jgi:hypothetical protein